MFIPKPGSNSWSGPRDHRPISLTSFLLKTMERSADRYRRDEALALVPLHPNKHAYWVGKSVEMALHQLVLKVEKALDHQETALGVFVDTEGTFNNTCYDTMCDALISHGSDYTTVRWIRATLEGCIVVAAFNGLSKRLVISRGCPHRGVLSPLLWCLVVDDLLATLNGNGVFIQGYADDIYLLMVGKFPNTASGLMQWALLTMKTWHNEVRLMVNPDKTGFVAFTRKRKLPGFFEPHFSGVKLSLSGSVKYLGVILDSPLTWREDVDVKMRKAHNLLWVCWWACGASWGLRPKGVHWLYVAIVRPSISSASSVWWPGCQMASSKEAKHSTMIGMLRDNGSDSYHSYWC